MTQLIRQTVVGPAADKNRHLRENGKGWASLRRGLFFCGSEKNRVPSSHQNYRGDPMIKKITSILIFAFSLLSFGFLNAASSEPISVPDDPIDTNGFQLLSEGDPTAIPDDPIDPGNGDPPPSIGSDSTGFPGDPIDPNNDEPPPKSGDSITVPDDPIVKSDPGTIPDDPIDPGNGDPPPKQDSITIPHDPIDPSDGPSKPPPDEPYP